MVPLHRLNDRLHARQPASFQPRVASNSPLRQSGIAADRPHSIMNVSTLDQAFGEVSVGVGHTLNGTGSGQSAVGGRNNAAVKPLAADRGDEDDEGRASGDFVAHDGFEERHEGAAGAEVRENGVDPEEHCARHVAAIPHSAVDDGSGMNLEKHGLCIVWSQVRLRRGAAQWDADVMVVAESVVLRPDL